MQIVLINHYAGSPRHGMEFRPYYLAREWVRAGHRVCIVAASASHLRQQGPVMQGHGMQQEWIDGIEYRWLAAPAYHGNGLARLRNMAVFLARLWHHGPALARQLQPDLVIASSTYPLDIWPAAAIARRAGARLVFEVHDLWPLTPVELHGMPRWHPFVCLLQAAENFACRRADTVVSMLPKVGSYLQQHGMAAHKLHWIPNGVDPAEWAPAGPALALPAAALLGELHAQGRFVVGYAGGHGQANALELLLEAAARLDPARYAVVLVGAGPDKAALMALARTLPHVHFLAPVPKAQVPALLAQFDLAYLGWRRHPLYRFGIAPNKLMDYMMAACPIVHAVEAGNDPVAEAACGMSIAPGDAAAVARAITTLSALEAQQRRQMGERGRAYVLARHSYQRLAPAFLQACAAAGPRPAFSFPPP